MDLSDLLSVEGIVPALRAGSKKQALQELAEKGGGDRGARWAHRVRDAAPARAARLHRGRARRRHPHGKMPELKRIVGVFARLDRAIDFEALDDEPVDLIFPAARARRGRRGSPQGARPIARVLRDGAIAAKLRATTDATAIYSLLTQPSRSNAA